MSGEFSMKAGGGRGPKAPTADRLVFSQRVCLYVCVCVFEPSREPAPPKGSVLSANTGCVGREKISGPCFGCRLCDFHARLALSLYLACRRPIHSNSSHFCPLQQDLTGVADVYNNFLNAFCMRRADQVGGEIYGAPLKPRSLALIFLISAVLPLRCAFIFSKSTSKAALFQFLDFQKLVGSLEIRCKRVLDVETTFQKKNVIKEK